MKKTALILAILAILSKITGFGREIVLAYFYGASNISDVYLIAMTIPGVIFEFVGVGVATSFIPIFSNIQKNSELNASNDFINNVINLLLLISATIVLFILIFAADVVKIFAPGFEGKTLELAVLFTRAFSFILFITSLVYVFTGFLQVHDNFIIPALIGIPMSILIMVSIILSATIDLQILMIGTIIAKISALLIMIPFVYKYRYKYKAVIDFKNKHLKQMIVVASPVILGVSVNQINTLVNRMIASTIAVGGLSALWYANRLNLFIQGVFVLSIATAMYPRISKFAVENDISGLKKTVVEAIGSINLIVIPSTIGCMIFVEPIVKLLFGRGAFDEQAVTMTSHALFYYSIGMIAFGHREILSRVFYSLQDTKTPMINAAISMVLNIILNFILSRYLGIGGLALATSISAIFCNALLFISLRKKIGPLKDMVNHSGKILIASVLMGFISQYVYTLLIEKVSLNIALITSIGFGAGLYLTIIYFMRIEEIIVLAEILERKLKKNNI